MIDTPLLEQLATDARNNGIHRLVVGAVVHHDGKILLLRRPIDDFMGGIFELPSGKVEPGETLDAALIREVKEETALDVSNLQSYLGHFDYVSGNGKNTRQFNFAVDVAELGPITLREHDEYAWTPLSQNAPVTDSVKNVLAEYRRCAQTCASDIIKPTSYN